MTVPASMTSQIPPTHGARAVATEGKTLPLESASLRVDARAGLARVVLEQRFRNPHAEALTVTYRMPLPADAAVSGFAFTLAGRRIVGQIDRKATARERFEEALVQGKSAALLDEETSSLFTQEIGNIPAGAEIVAEITLDQPLTFLAEGAWELRFPLAAAPRYLGTAAPSLGNVVLDVASGSLAARASLSMTIGDELVRGRSPESPSHALQCTPKGAGFAVELGSQNEAELDRDVVIRWPVARPTPSVELAFSGPISVRAPDGDRGERAPKTSSIFALATIVPPDASTKPRAVARYLTLLIDTSGSMDGEPLSQAKRVASALVESLSDGDTLELFEFSFTTTAFRPQPERATRATKTEALRWINGLVASGGTEMLTGIRAALRDLQNEAQRQIVLITDGLVGFERDVVSALISGLPPASRFHALGVGAAANRSLLMPVARAGRGIEAILGIGEDPERAATRLLDRMRAPIVVDLAVSGSALVRAVPDRLPDLFGGSPARLALELAPQGGDLVLRGRTTDGEFVWTRTIAPSNEREVSDAIAKLFARERVEDLEARIAGGESKALLDGEIEGLGLAFAISTRLTSWIAVTEEATVDPRNPTRRQVMPQALPFGMSAEGLGLRSPSFGPASAMLPPIGAQAYSVRGGGMAPPVPQAAAPMRARSMPADAMRSAAPPPRREPPGQLAEKARSTTGAPAAPPRPAAPPPPAHAKRPSAPAPTAPGLLSKVVGAVRDTFSHDPSSSTGADDESKGEARSAGFARRELRARLVLAKGREVIIEVDVDGEDVELLYAGADVTVSLDGSTKLARQRIDMARSTREGRIATGTTIRIVILLDADVTAGANVSAVLEMGALRIVL